MLGRFQVNCFVVDSRSGGISSAIQLSAGGNYVHRGKLDSGWSRIWRSLRQQYCQNVMKHRSECNEEAVQGFHTIKLYTNSSRKHRALLFICGALRPLWSICAQISKADFWAAGKRPQPAAKPYCELTVNLRVNEPVAHWIHKFHKASYAGRSRVTLVPRLLVEQHSHTVGTPLWLRFNCVETDVVERWRTKWCWNECSTWHLFNSWYSNPGSLYDIFVQLFLIDSIN